MPNIKGTNLTWNFIVFVAGVLLSALFSTWLGGLVVSQYLFLAAVIVLLVLAIIFFFTRISQRFEQTSQKIERLYSQAVSVVDYCNEPYLADEGIEYKGIIFDELAELVESARKEVLILGATRPREKPYKASNHEKRETYHRTIERKVKANADKDFTYIRINQVRHEFLSQPPKQYLGSTLSAHYQRLSALKKECKELKATVVVLNVPIQYLASIWFIDGSSIVIEVTGITEDDSPYPAGLIRITDRGGSISLKFRRIFDELQRKGRLVKLSEFD